MQWFINKELFALLCPPCTLFTGFELALQEHNLHNVHLKLSILWTQYDHLESQHRKH